MDHTDQFDAVGDGTIKDQLAPDGKITQVQRKLRHAAAQFGRGGQRPETLIEPVDQAVGGGEVMRRDVAWIWS